MATALPASAQSDEPVRSPQGVTGDAVGGPVDLDAEVRVFVQLDEPSVAEFVAASEGDPPPGVQRAQARKVQAQQASAQPAIESTGAEVVNNLVVGANGFVVNATLREIPVLESLDDVRSVARVTVFEPTNETSVPWIGAPEVWETGFTGEGISIGIVDTGIDYYHANMGGSGDPADFEADDGLDLADGNFPNSKVVGGFDFAGDAYDADPDSPSYNPVPSPDSDPLDCQGHGSHVAGSAAGLGVDGQIGPGVAPAADLYALRVFGCDGSTDLVSSALEWAMDPDGDGSMDDHLDVINMSLGSPFGSPDDPSTIATGNAVAAGVVVVASAGNEGSAPYVTGSPGVNAEAISVAASVDGGYAALGISYSVDGGDPIPTEAAEAAFTPPLAQVGPVAGDVVEIDDDTGDSNDGCEPATAENAAAISGNIALVERGVCDFVVKVANAEAAGAVATIVFNDAARGDALINMGGSGDFGAPAVFIGHTAGQAMSDAYNNGSTVAATLSDEIVIPKPELGDTLADFTSRGPGFGTTFKPDVAAPGFGINSTSVGTGTLGRLSSGTSMAAPHVAGLAALLLDKDGGLAPAEVKALVMNSTSPAAQDYPLALQGTGVVQAESAAGLGSYAMPGGLSFGRVDSSRISNVTKDIVITNMTEQAQTYTVTHEPLTEVSGVSLQVMGDSVRVGPNSSKTVKVRLKVRPAEMTPDDNFFSQREVDGWFVISSSSDEMRVGYMAVVDPGANVNVNSIFNHLLFVNTAATDGVAEGFGLIGESDGDGAFEISRLGVRTHDLYGFPVIEFGFATAQPWPTFSPYEVNIYIDDVPNTSSPAGCPEAGPETAIVAADFGILTGGDPSGDLVTAVFNLCDNSFPLDFFAGMDYNDGVGVLTDDPALVFPYDGDGVFSYEVYSFDYYTTDLGYLSGDVDLNSLPSVANPSQAVTHGATWALSGENEGEMLWLFPNNSAGDQSTIVEIKIPRWFRFPW
jgi:minor extracellular serine protease Vpr